MHIESFKLPFLKSIANPHVQDGALKALKMA